MNYVFLQNMRSFGGAAPARNDTFETALRSCKANMLQSEYECCVAAFSEVMNSRNAVEATRFLSGLLISSTKLETVSLDTGGTTFTNEFISIHWDPSIFKAFACGTVRKGPTNGLTGKSWYAFAWNGSNYLNPNISLEHTITNQRGPCYIIGEMNHENVAFIFAHNMYRETSPLELVHGLTEIVDAVRGQSSVQLHRIVFGADWNLVPGQILRDLPHGFGLYAAMYSDGQFQITSRKNPFDYWISDSVGMPDVVRQTDKDLGSDHCGIILALC